jgi:hypothetical protein
MVTDPSDGTPSRTGPRPQSPAKPDGRPQRLHRAREQPHHALPPASSTNSTEPRPGTSPHAPTPSAHQAHRAPSAISEQTPLPIIEVRRSAAARVAASGALRAGRASSMSGARVPALRREQVSRCAWRETRNSPAASRAASSASVAVADRSDVPAFPCPRVSATGRRGTDPRPRFDSARGVLAANARALLVANSRAGRIASWGSFGCKHQRWMQ